MSRYGVVFVGAIAVLAVLGLVIQRPEAPAPKPSRVGGRDASGCRESCANPRALALIWARRSGTWDFRSVGTNLTALSRLATPRLARQIRRNARVLDADRGVSRERARQASRVIALLTESTGARRRVLVVSRELSFTRLGPDGHGPRHRVYRGTAMRIKDGWRMAEWERLP